MAIPNEKQRPISVRSKYRSKVKSKAKINSTRKSKRKTRIKSKSKIYWSQNVTNNSNAMDLEQGVFTWNEPRKIAESLKRSVEASNRLKGSKFKSAMNMLTFYINRAGTNLSPVRLKILEKAKDELRIIFKKK